MAYCHISVRTLLLAGNRTPSPIQTARKIYRHTSFCCVLLYCASQILLFSFTNWRFVATLYPASLLVPFSNSICSLCVSASHFGNSRNISNFFLLLFYFYGDPRSLMLLLQLTNTQTDDRIFK